MRRPGPWGGREQADRSVQGTNDDASVSKMSCVNLGYFEDDFLGHFVRKPTQRPPLINRGYFARVQIVRQLMSGFLRSAEEEGTGGQVLSLGAGWDTAYFRLKLQGKQPRLYVEVDHAEVTASKCRVTERSPALMAALDAGARVDAKLGSITSASYCLMPGDLRDLTQVSDAARRAGLEPSRPTLVLMECVTAYLERAATADLLGWASRVFPNCAIVTYDMFGPNDAFGQQLLANVESRGCPLPGMRSFPTLESRRDLLASCGMERARVVDMLHVYDREIDEAERRRAERIEIFDEFEEWRLIMSHYCVAAGCKGTARLPWG